MIISALNKCNIIIFVLSANSMRSVYAQKEVKYAYYKQKKLVPMQIDNAELTDWFLFNFNGIDIIDYNKQNQQQKLFADLITWEDNTSCKTTRKSADETNDKQDYSLFQNNADELMLMIGSFHTPHDDSRLLYDGGDRMLLYHDSENSLLLKDISSEASKALTTMKKILVVETQDNDVVNEYTVPIHLINDVEPLIVK